MPLGKIGKNGFPLAADPVYYKDFTIYTCPSTFNWRIVKKGNVVDKKSSWKVQGVQEVWSKVHEIISNWE